MAALAGCDSAEERANKHFQSAVDLIEEGDLRRGVVELRNVFKLDEQHLEARRLFAATLRQRGNDGAAFAQYVRLLEAIPDDQEALRALAELAYGFGDGNEAITRVNAALEVMPEDASLLAYDAMLDYQVARSGAGDPVARRDAVARATQLIAENPELEIARQAVVSDMIDRGQFDQALETIDAGLALNDRSKPLYASQLAAMQQLGDKEGVESALKKLIELFPNDRSYWSSLVKWYVSENRLADAEQWLRDRIDGAGTDLEPRMSLLQFKTELQGNKAALSEIDEALQLDPLPEDLAANLPAFRGLRAGMLFTDGQTDAAIAEFEALIDEYAAADELSGDERDAQNRFKVALAQIRTRTGNDVGARALVEEVLADDSANASALKLKGEWLIADDLTDDAIVVLREALSSSPRDATALSLLAEAYGRQGNRQLVGQMLSEAVAASNSAPDETARYAQFLMQDEEFLATEDVLIDALRRDNTNLRLLSLLTQVHLAMQDWPRTESDIARLREIARQTDSQDTRNTANALANELRARMLSARGEADELLSFLGDLAESAGESGTQDSLAAQAALIRVLVTSGQIDDAVSRSRALVETHEDDPRAEYVLASVLAVDGQNEEAEQLLRKALDTQPTLRDAWTLLYRLRMRAEDIDGAFAALESAEAALPNDLTLKWARAGLLERQGDIDSAIAVYEDMYVQNNSSPVIANNLASLLSSHRDDPETLDRAWTVARRLKGTEVPAFADTYGWIAFLRGQSEEALSYLQLAAEGLPNDPTVQYHLGRVHAELGQIQQAEEAYNRAAQLIDEGGLAGPGLSAQLEQAVAGLQDG